VSFIDLQAIMILKLFRYFWASPVTALGLLFVPPTLLGKGRIRVVDGVIEIHGGLAAWFLARCTPVPGGATAMTLGHIVLGRDQISLDLTRSHERIHVRQCERWGAAFVPAYLLASLWALIKRRDPYFGNCFEQEAMKKSSFSRQKSIARAD